MIFMFKWMRVHRKGIVLGALFGITKAIGSLLHWMICNNYLKVTIEVKSLLDKDIIMHNGEKINEIDQKKLYLQAANVINIFLCLISGAIFAWGFSKDNTGQIAFYAYMFALAL